LNTYMEDHQAGMLQSLCSCCCYCYFIQAGHILCQGYIREKHRANQTQNSCYKHVFPGGEVIDSLILYSVWLYQKWTCTDQWSIYLLYIQNMYIFLFTLHTFYIYLFIYNEIKLEETDFHNFWYGSFW